MSSVPIQMKIQIKTKIDGAFILAAGMGTRMGPVGQQLPKPLWPLPGGMSLLEWQCRQLLALGINQVMINVHHQRSLMYGAIEDLKSRYPQLTFMISDEPQLLDVGGGIHQMCRLLPKNYSGTYLLLNVDYLWQLKQSHLIALAGQLSNATAVVLQLTAVNHDATYNRIQFSPTFDFESVVAPSTVNAPPWTYGGIALLQLDHLAHQQDPIIASNFFKTVVCPQVKTKVVLPTASQPLLGNDVGTLAQYGDYVRTKIMTTDQHLTLPMPYLQGHQRRLHLEWDRGGQYFASLVL